MKDVNNVKTPRWLSSRAMLHFVLIGLTLFPLVVILAGQEPSYEFMDLVMIKSDARLHPS